MPTRITTPSSSSPFDQLEREWAATVTAPHFAVRRRAWLAVHPVLGEPAAAALTDERCGTAAAVFPEPAVARAALAGLAQLHLDGDRIATRALLQAMLPAARSLARRARRPGRGLHEAQSLAVSSMWEAIMALSRVPANVPGTLKLEALHRISRATDLDVVAPDGAAFVELSDAIVEPECERSATLEVLELLAWGVDHGAITRSEAALLARCYAPGDSEVEQQAAVARDLGIAHAAVRQRASRAVRKLATAATARRADPSRSVRSR